MRMGCIGLPMVKNGHVSAIRRMTYEPGASELSVVETMTFDRLRTLNDGGTQRADFHILACVHNGSGSVMIDFVTYRLKACSAVWIPPGSVHRWAEIGSLAGDLALFLPTAAVTPATRELLASPDLAACWSVSADDWALLTVAWSHLTLETHTDASTEIPQILLSALLARSRPPRASGLAANPLFALFQASVEENFRAHHDVGFYARALGFAPRTLTRAVQQATGVTAKAYIAERLALEAKRLLAHDGFTSARCAAELGFADASNFSVFFKRATRSRPGEWQKAPLG